eukprot:bmy_05809T0
MACDQFQAMCHPLLYVMAMNKKVCTGLVGAFWAIGMGMGLVNTILLAQHHFCGPNLIHSFACELPPVLVLTCCEPYINIASILTTMVVLGLGTLVLLLGSYTRIMTAVGINSATGRSKIFSTCSSHFLEVTILYGSGVFSQRKMHLKGQMFIPLSITNIMCCDSGVIPRAINVRENDSIIGLAYSFIRNNHHKMFLPLAVDLALRTLLAESGMGWTVAANSIVATVLSSVYSFVQFLSSPTVDVESKAVKLEVRLTAKKEIIPGVGSKKPQEHVLVLGSRMSPTYFRNKGGLRAYLGSSDKKDRGLMGTIINFQRRMSILGDEPKKKSKHDLSTEELYGKT